ncbi:hypothetical protein M438DRAFT_208650 [Aureobasidium pullulans EXF-150]|uniref:Uncharacterized protein n=1 Tax=Aureobasidium pullulans EXF-150 TaxID=1043002 RepID=A0A074XI37_AURPU|nr:uncharacterized protein M438DRAFT_208650 [Aureobasidium pullulans EXF-150]KEQ85158.1 hypothetical protein M438DRAFT_208650 [Aureobasidium pullulans EXF-150]
MSGVTNGGGMARSGTRPFHKGKKQTEQSSDSLCIVTATHPTDPDLPASPNSSARNLYAVQFLHTVIAGMAEQAHIVARIAALDQGSFKDVTKQAFQLIASCYEKDEFVECIEGAQHILDTYPLNTQMRLKVYIYMAMSTKEPARRGRLRDLAEIAYAAIITDLPAGKSPGNNLINARKELDALTAGLLRDESSSGKPDDTATSDLIIFEDLPPRGTEAETSGTKGGQIFITPGVLPHRSIGAMHGILDKYEPRQEKPQEKKGLFSAMRNPMARKKTASARFVEPDPDENDQESPRPRVRFNASDALPGTQLQPPNQPPPSIRPPPTTQGRFDSLLGKAGFARGTVSSKLKAAESLEVSKRSARSLSRMTGANQSTVSLAASTSARGNATKPSGQMATSRSHPALPTGDGSLARRPSHKHNESSGTIGRGHARHNSEISKGSSNDHKQDSSGVNTGTIRRKYVADLTMEACLSVR